MTPQRLRALRAQLWCVCSDFSLLYLRHGAVSRAMWVIIVRTIFTAFAHLESLTPLSCKQPCRTIEELGYPAVVQDSGTGMPFCTRTHGLPCARLMLAVGLLQQESGCSRLITDCSTALHGQTKGERTGCARASQDRGQTRAAPCKTL